MYQCPSQRCAVYLKCILCFYLKFQFYTWSSKKYKYRPTQFYEDGLLLDQYLYRPNQGVRTSFGENVKEAKNASVVDNEATRIV